MAIGSRTPGRAASGRGRSGRAASGAEPGRAAFGGTAPGRAPPGRTTSPRLGYALAALNMVISGVAIYVNSLGVKMFSDSTVYTALKNSVVGIALLVPLAFSARSRADWRTLKAHQWALLVVVALIGGSVSYALYFRGLQLTTPVTASLVDHTQFLFVALFAALFIGERFNTAVWVALGVLFAGVTLAIGAGAVRLDAGMPFVAAATLFFAADFVLMKYLLRSVSALTVMTFKMTVGSFLLILFVATTGRAGEIARLSPLQLGFVGITGLILLAFSVTSVLGLRHASATATTAIPAGAPIITTVLVVLSRHVEIPPVRWLGLSLALVAVLMVFILGRRQEQGGVVPSPPRQTP